jgi:hypothetical protein
MNGGGVSVYSDETTARIKQLWAEMNRTHELLVDQIVKVSCCKPLRIQPTTKRQAVSRVTTPIFHRIGLK